jgi:hypothetical protein
MPVVADTVERRQRVAPSATWRDTTPSSFRTSV